jgi:hypothetical protein
MPLRFRIIDAEFPDLESLLAMCLTARRSQPGKTAAANGLLTQICDVLTPRSGDSLMHAGGDRCLLE